MGNGRRRRAAATVVAAAGLLVFVAACASSPPQPSASPVSSTPPVDQPTTPTPAPEPTFDPGRLSIDDPDSIWVIVNKRRPLDPADYHPADLVEVPVPYVNAPELRREAADAAVELFDAAADEGLDLAAQSAYRSYSTQVRVYDGWVEQLGKAKADGTSARPGHSEHQTGLALDIASLPAECSLEACFGETPHGRWLADNAWRFGFVLRYPEGKTAITGYEYEPWHFRYVGTELAEELHDRGVATLEEFFDLPPAPDYAD